MKYAILLMLVFIFTGNESYCQKKAEFDYPANVVADSSKKTFEKDFKKGKVLYTVTCAQCHNVKEGGKEIIPDFSLPQLLDYEMRFYYPEHQDRLKDNKIKDEEMNRIILFLRYKKKSGRPIHG